MRILVLSDSHGFLGLINKLVEKHKADAVVHCGDFGLELESRLPLTPDRELSLRIRHASPTSTLPPQLRKQCFKMSREEKINVIKEHKLLGELDEFVEGKQKFLVPVYCTWGNHEDEYVIQQIQQGKVVVPNLHLVNELSDILLDGWIRLVGIGGNLIHWLFFDREEPNNALPKHPALDSLRPYKTFYPSMRFSQWIRLFERFKPSVDYLKENELERLKQQPQPPKEKQEKRERPQIEKPKQNERKGKQKEKEKLEDSEQNQNEHTDSKPPQSSNAKKPPKNNQQNKKEKQLEGNNNNNNGSSAEHSQKKKEKNHNKSAQNKKSPPISKEKDQKTEPEISKEMMWFVTHISPGKEPMLEWFSHLLRPAFYFSGHMGPFLPDRYTLFTTMDDPDFLSRVSNDLNFVRNLFSEYQWCWKLWYLAWDLLAQQEEKLQHKPIFEECDQNGKRWVELFMSKEQIEKIVNIESSHELANNMLGLFVRAGAVSEDDKKEKFHPFPHPACIPDKEDIEKMRIKLEELFTLPIISQLNTDRDAFLYKPSNIVKCGPQFYVLPDVYMGGYIVVDTDAEKHELSVNTIGTFPPKHII